jgi:predicted DNA-binding transcriptional regulator AlpA
MEKIEYLTERQVSVMTQIALSTLRNNRFMKRGIRYIKIGRSVRYSLEDVIAYMEDRKIQTDS